MDTSQFLIFITRCVCTHWHCGDDDFNARWEYHGKIEMTTVIRGIEWL